MKINRQLLNSAAKEGIITSEQADNLWAFFEKNLEEVPSFNFTHILYYFGGLVAITAMTLFITLGWEKLGGFGILLTSVIYMGIGIGITNYLFRKKLNIPAGIVAAFVVALTPLAIYGLQKGLGYWPDQYNYQDYHRIVQGLWLIMEIGTLIVAAILFYIYRRPFMILPVAVTLWYMSMDLTVYLFNAPDVNYWDNRRIVSLVFGLLMLLFAFYIDFRTKSKLDYAFHLYLFGMIAFWSGLTFTESSNEWSKLLYCGINVALIVIGSVISRLVFTVFGALGVFIYLGHLSYEVFKDSIFFPVILSLIGFGIIYLGILWHRHEEKWVNSLKRVMPKAVRKVIEKNR